MMMMKERREEEENTDYLTDSNKENETDEENTVRIIKTLLFEIVHHISI